MNCTGRDRIEVRTFQINFAFIVTTTTIGFITTVVNITASTEESFTADVI